MSDLCSGFLPGQSIRWTTFASMIEKGKQHNQ
jgi:hypothetical protein